MKRRLHVLDVVQRAVPDRDMKTHLLRLCRALLLCQVFGVLLSSFFGFLQRLFFQLFHLLFLLFCISKTQIRKPLVIHNYRIGVSKDMQTFPR